MKHMVVRYNYVVVGFSQDLTDPKTKSVPIAVVGSGEASPSGSSVAGGGFTFVMAHPAPVVADPVMRQFLAEFPHRLRDEVELGVRTVGTGRLLGWLSGRLAGQSAHVVQTGQKEVKADDPSSVLVEVARGVEKVIEGNFPSAARSGAGPRGSLPDFTFGPVPELTKAR